MFSMTIRNRMSIIVLVLAGLLIALGDKFAGMLLLSLLLPVYGLAISSVFLFILIAMASVAVTVARFFRHEDGPTEAARSDNFMRPDQRKRDAA
jgi:Na+-transporting methylmalonyl-CoA/oxaloacetate decarboxylase gamma subunit